MGKPPKSDLSFLSGGQLPPNRVKLPSRAQKAQNRLRFSPKIAVGYPPDTVDFQLSSFVRCPSCVNCPSVPKRTFFFSGEHTYRSRFSKNERTYMGVLKLGQLPCMYEVYTRCEKCCVLPQKWPCGHLFTQPPGFGSVLGGVFGPILA